MIGALLLAALVAAGGTLSALRRIQRFRRRAAAASAAAHATQAARRASGASARPVVVAGDDGGVGGWLRIATYVLPERRGGPMRGARAAMDPGLRLTRDGQPLSLSSAAGLEIHVASVRHVLIEAGSEERWGIELPSGTSCYLAGRWPARDDGYRAGPLRVEALLGEMDGTSDFYVLADNDPVPAYLALPQTEPPPPWHRAAWPMMAAAALATIGFAITSPVALAVLVALYAALVVVVEWLAWSNVPPPS